MTNRFFSSLVSRHTGRVSRVEPRLGSHFEHQGASISQELESAADRNAPQRQSNATESRTSRAGAKTPANMAESAPQIRRSDGQPRPATDFDFTGAGEAITAGASSSREDMTSSPIQASGSVPENRDPVPWSLRAEALINRLAAASGRDTTSIRQEPLIPEASQHLATTTRDKRQSGEADLSGNLDAPVTKNADEAGSEPAQGVPQNPASSESPVDWMAALNQKLRRNRPSTESVTEPVINVTIGRVEVRSTGKTNPHLAPERRKPTIMSLDEYLERGKQGRSS